MPLGITNTKLAETLGVSRKAISSIVNGRKAITPEMALPFDANLMNF
jgi:antitoxin HigA-1